MTERPDTPGVSAASTAQLGRVARGGAANLVGAVVSAIAGFLLVIVVARDFSPDAAGSLFSAISIFLVLSAVTTLGTDAGLSRFMLRCEAHNRYGDIPVLLRLAFRPVVVANVAVTALLLGFADPIAPRLGLDEFSGPGILRIMAFAIPFASVATFALASTQAFGRMRPSVIVDSTLRPMLQLLAVLFVGSIGAGVLALTWAWALPYIAAAAVSIWLAVRLFESRSRNWPVQDHGDRSALRREFWTFTWPRGFARIFQIALQRVDIIIIAVLIDTAAAAVYTAATRFVVFGQFAVQAIQRVLQPRFSKLLASDELDVVRDVFKISTAWSMALSWPLYLAIAVAAPLYLRLFGSAYELDGRTTVTVMAVAMMAAVAAGPLDTLLLMSGRSLASLGNTATALALNVGLCFALIPPLGVTGAAIAWGVAVVVRNALAFVQIRHHLGITPFDRSGLIVTVASLIWIPLPILASSAIWGLSLGSFLPALVVGCAGYVATLWRAREPLALDALRHMLRRSSATTGG